MSVSVSMCVREATQSVPCTRTKSCTTLVRRRVKKEWGRRRQTRRLAADAGKSWWYSGGGWRPTGGTRRQHAGAVVEGWSLMLDRDSGGEWGGGR